MGKQCDNRLALPFMPKFDTNATTKLSSQAVVELLKLVSRRTRTRQRETRTEYRATSVVYNAYKGCKLDHFSRATSFALWSGLKSLRYSQ